MLSQDVIDRAQTRVGQTLRDKWHLDRVIGVGGMAAVYEATHRNRNRVAIKMLHPELSLDENTRGRFLREGYAANTIHHKGVVEVLDDDVTEDDIAFLVMELLIGESVEERAVRKGGVLGDREVLSLTDQLLDVLAVAHEQGVVHRDIKPDNLFLTVDGQLKVLDFGIARVQQGDGSATRVGSFMGTPAFSAPEQARGRWNEVDARTDLFAVGATIFTLVTSMHVHDGETASEQLAAAVSSRARSLAILRPNAPAALVDFVDRALQYDKSERFQSAAEMKEALRRVIADLPNDSSAELRPVPGVGTRLSNAPTVDEEEHRILGLSSRSVWALLGGVGAVGLAAILLLLAGNQAPHGGDSKEEKTAAEPTGSDDLPSEAPSVPPLGANAELEVVAAKMGPDADDVAAASLATPSPAAAAASGSPSATVPTTRPPTAKTTSSGDSAKASSISSASPPKSGPSNSTTLPSPSSSGEEIDELFDRRY